MSLEGPKVVMFGGWDGTFLAIDTGESVEDVARDSDRLPRPVRRGDTSSEWL